MAFRAAGRLAMAEGMPKCSPVLLEPVRWRLKSPCLIGGDGQN